MDSFKVGYSTSGLPAVTITGATGSASSVNGFGFTIVTGEGYGAGASGSIQLRTANGVDGASGSMNVGTGDGGPGCSAGAITLSVGSGGNKTATGSDPATGGSVRGLYLGKNGLTRHAGNAVSVDGPAVGGSCVDGIYVTGAAGGDADASGSGDASGGHGEDVWILPGRGGDAASGSGSSTGGNAGGYYVILPRGGTGATPGEGGYYVLESSNGLGLLVGDDEGLCVGNDTNVPVGFHGFFCEQRASADQAAATDLASVLTLANELREALIEKGIIKGGA